MLYTNDIINGTYQIIREIGQGGAGVVYLAYHRNLQKYIVLKRLKSHITNPDIFRRETDILKNLHHVGLPQVYDFVSFDGSVFSVMDYIEGTPLDQIGCGPNVFTEKDIVEWLRQLTEVLMYLHGQNPPVIHSDIKPENVILRPDGQMVLIDFNISLEGSTPGKVAGFSRAYAAPEQAYLAQMVSNGMQGDYALDVRTDLYSLGAMFHYLVSGEAPDCYQETMRLTGRPGLIYSQALLEVIDRLTEWNREKRYPTARRLLFSLDRLSRMGPKYRMYLLLRSVSILGSALIIAGGCYCLVHGFQKQIEESYQADYRAFSTAIDMNEKESAAREAEDILHNREYSRVLSSNAYDAAYLNYVVAQAAVQAEDYLQAESGFTAAKEWLAGASDERSLQLLEAIRLDEVVAISQEGDYGKAQVYLQQLENRSSDRGIYLLLKLSLALDGLDTGEAVNTCNELFADASVAKEIKVRACQLESDYYQAEGGIQEQLVWLKRLTQFSNSSDDLRYAAYQALDISQGVSVSEALQKEAANFSLQCYRAFINTEDATVVDHINYAIVLRDFEWYDQSIQELMQVYTEEKKKDSVPAVFFRACALLSISYRESGDLQSADRYRKEADAAYRSLTETDMEEKNLYEQLKE